MQIETAVLGTVKEWFTEYRDPDTKIAGLPEGPWSAEPSKMQWVDRATGMPCLIVRNGFGALCGYAGVTPGHPLHGCNYDDFDADVHGGLTFADRCQPTTDEAHGVCHVPEPGTPHDVWWFGFDCAHLGDVVPGMISVHERIGFSGRSELDRGEYRDVAYVAHEVTRLAEQLHQRGQVVTA
jgi:hypothetical protein